MIIQQTVNTNIGVQDGRIVVAREQDVEPLLEQAKSLHNEGLHTSAAGDKLAGIMPDVLIEAYINQKGITYREFLQGSEHIRAMLNDPALSHFRVWKGAL